MMTFVVSGESAEKDSMAGVSEDESQELVVFCCTAAVSSVGEVDAVYVERPAEVHRQPSAALPTIR